jgi:hypothetical protein
MRSRSIIAVAALAAITLPGLLFNTHAAIDVGSKVVIPALIAFVAYQVIL